MEKTINIAIVDDEIEILNLLSRYFNKVGKYKVSTFGNPVIAVDAIARDSFDIVLLDIMMPQMDGVEALEKIISQNPDQKVCMMTAYSTLDKVLNSHKKGATHYVMKPFSSLSALETKIEEILKPK